MADAMAELKELKALIDNALGRFFDEQIIEAEKTGSFASDLLRNLKEFNLRGGKRLRPAFLISGFRCFAEPAEEDIIYASLAIELMEGFFLIHDDVLDQDSMRRGGPAFHKIYETMHDDPQFGEGAAIVAGDIQNSLANMIIASCRFSDKKKVDFLRLYHDTAITTEYGWMFESMLTKRMISDITEEDIMKVCRYKTAAYTVEGPLLIGAMLAGGDDKSIKSLRDFAVPLGQAFQIQDDILGMFGDEKKLGKPVGSDLKEGKTTLLIVKAFENASEQQRKELLDVFGKKDLTPEDVEKARSIISCTGSLDYSRNLAERLIGQAKDALGKADLRKEGKDFLTGIADFMVKREY